MTQPIQDDGTDQDGRRDGPSYFGARVIRYPKEEGGGGLCCGLTSLCHISNPKRYFYT